MIIVDRKGSACIKTKKHIPLQQKINIRKWKRSKKLEWYEAYQKINSRLYNSNYSAILQTDATCPGVISSNTIVIEINSTGYLTMAMLIVDVIIKEGYVVDVLPDKYTVNIIPTGTSWVKKL